MNQFATAAIIADDTGIIAGTSAAIEKALELGLKFISVVQEGAFVSTGDEVIRFSGNPKQIAMAEDFLIGCIAKPSGIATATERCVKKAGENIRIVCGSWKKMPLYMKETIRKAVVVGGGDLRISRQPFIYLDKNYIRMLGGIKKSLEAVSHFTNHQKVIQIKGIEKDIAAEALEAARFHADIIYIDSGSHEDLRIVSRELNKNSLRVNVKIAFGGNVRIKDIDVLKTMDVDILGIGKEIIDAPLLDLKMEVI